MPKLILTVGLPGSGKTTWADEASEHSGAVRISRDDVRKLLGIYGKWQPKREREVTDLQRHHIRKALLDGNDVIVDDTNLNAKTLARLEKLGDECGAEVIINYSFLTVPIEDCIRRDANRAAPAGGVGKDVIERMYYQYWDSQPRPANEGKFSALICDLDGTLAIPPGASYSGLFAPGTYPYGRDYRNDGVNTAILHILSVWDQDVILLSGRDECRREQTEEWLRMYHVPSDRLFMRPDDDKRKDHQVKKDLYLQHVQGNWKVEFVLDDRPSVVRMWRAELGLRVLQVGPNIEF